MWFGQWTKLTVKTNKKKSFGFDIKLRIFCQFANIIL